MQSPKNKNVIHLFCNKHAILRITNCSTIEKRKMIIKFFVKYLFKSCYVFSKKILWRQNLHLRVMAGCLFSVALPFFKNQLINTFKTSVFV